MSDIGFSDNEQTSTTGDKSMHIATVARAEVNVFFDGTGNNFFNVTAEQKRTGQASYENALSNIARMWFGIDPGPDVIAVYVDGIGTTRLQTDSLIGMALGRGPTGIVDRVDSTFPELVAKILEKRGRDELPAIIDINVFGFSRGAAAARRFVHLTNVEKRRFGADFQKIRIRCNFVGLFDTVASFGLNHENDVTDLHLNFSPSYAVKVFHLIAGDEYRHNFPVSTIASALALQVQSDVGSHRMGYELCIPGAHSDVGGGYHPVEPEERDLPYMIRDFVYEQGWFKATDMTKHFWGTHHREVNGEFYKIGLALMLDQAHQYSTTAFPPELIEPVTDPDVQSLRDTLRAFAADEKNVIWDLSKQWEEDRARALRHRLIHQSSTDSGTMAFHYEAGTPKRQYLQG